MISVWVWAQAVPFQVPSVQVAWAGVVVVVVLKQIPKFPG